MRVLWCTKAVCFTSPCHTQHGTLGGRAQTTLNANKPSPLFGLRRCVVFGCSDCTCFMCKQGQGLPGGIAEVSASQDPAQPDQSRQVPEAAAGRPAHHPPQTRRQHVRHGAPPARGHGVPGTGAGRPHTQVRSVVANQPRPSLKTHTHTRARARVSMPSHPVVTLTYQPTHLLQLGAGEGFDKECAVDAVNYADCVAANLQSYQRAGHHPAPRTAALPPSTASSPPPPPRRRVAAGVPTQAHARTGAATRRPPQRGTVAVASDQRSSRGRVRLNARPRSAQRPAAQLCDRDSGCM